MASILKPINYSDTNLIPMKDYGFDFAVSLHGLINYPVEYGQLQVNVHRKTWINGDWASMKFENERVQMDPCNDTNFNHTNKDEM
mmetsp:Transcript_5913/g.4468  ORF Transcript_5913/g.4468 Transcript_5913/m.4468 type:complete len:85 (-) Transcript_5913:725-979(-)